MKELVFVASHVGYPMDRTPLGGGATVGVQLARVWAEMGGFKLTVAGSGPESPAPGIDYHRLPGKDYDLVKLSEMGYARFCRKFEQASTKFVLEHAFETGKAPCVVVNDISEGPDLRRLRAAGCKIVSIWHVDVVDYFNKMYFRGLVAPERVTRAFEALRPWAGWAVPDVLKLVFEKQRETVACSDRLILPSRAMVETLHRCYKKLKTSGPSLEKRALVVPWGGWEEYVDEAAASARAEELRRQYELSPETRVLMTLSRLSPEKGIHLAIEALRRLENSTTAPRDVTLFICGEAAFMGGAAYDRRLRRMATRLKRYRIHFPGYVAGVEKHAFFKVSQLFLSPSIHDSYGLTVVEALRAGLPVLASDHHGVAEIFSQEGATDEKRGYARAVSYAKGDASGGLKAELVRLLAEPGLLKAMGERAAKAGAGMTFQDAARRVAEASLELL